MATTTAQQRRDADRVLYDAMLAGCPTRQVMATVGGKWSMLVIVALAGGALRHGQLRTTIAGVSQKMLTQTLRELERDGLVTRTVIATVPVTVHYDLTDLGRSIVPVVRAIKDWSEANIERVQASRERFDAATDR